MNWNASGKYGEKGSEGEMKKVGGKVDAPGAEGDRGIPPGMKSGGAGEYKKSVEDIGSAGDKGIPPFGQNPTAKAPLD